MAVNDGYRPIGDYGMVSDMRSCALVSRDGSIDYACFPRFDSRAVFSRILDAERGGYFQIVPRGIHSVARKYIHDTNVLETTFETADGAAKLTDFMPIESDEAGDREKIDRILHCTRGHVEFDVVCKPRFDFGTIVPSVHLNDRQVAYAHGGSDAISFYCSAPLKIADHGFEADGRLRRGERLYASSAHAPAFSHQISPSVPDEIEKHLKRTIKFWKEWAKQSTYDGKHRDEVMRSALVLKGLTYEPSGAILAAATTSLPEDIGGERNWDYRFTWIRDATLALQALFRLGYTQEAEDFRTWIEWATLGRATDVQPMYGISGERRLTEVELPELSGYRGSRPVRHGNAAYQQFQLDVYGELMDSAHQYRRAQRRLDEKYWDYLCEVVEEVMKRWQEPDEGIWETRGGRQHFVLSKVMCWVALDRAIKAQRALGLPGDAERWKAARTTIRQDILEKGYDEERGAFVQAYGNKNFDASNLLLPLLGFIKADDKCMESTIEGIARELTSPQGFVYRYRNYDDGLTGGESPFLICTYWLADNFILLGQMKRAQELFDRARACANDLGLYGEQYEPTTNEILGNFPQAFSHLAFITTAVMLHEASSPEHTKRKKRRS